MSIDSDKNYEIESIISKLEKLTNESINSLIEATEEYDNNNTVLDCLKYQISRIINETKYTINNLNDEIDGYEHELKDNVNIYERKIMLYLFRLLYSNNCRTLYYAYNDLKILIDTLIDKWIDLTIPKYNNIYGNEKLHNFILEMKYNL